MSEAGDEAENGGLREALPGLARIYASTWLNTAEWTLETAARSSARLARAALGRESASALYDETAADLRAYARRMLEILDREGRAGGVSELLRDDGPAATGE